MYMINNTFCVVQQCAEGADFCTKWCGRTFLVTLQCSKEHYKQQSCLVGSIIFRDTSCMEIKSRRNFPNQSYFHKKMHNHLLLVLCKTFTSFSVFSLKRDFWFGVWSNDAIKLKTTKELNSNHGLLFTSFKKTPKHQCKKKESQSTKKKNYF